MIFLLDTCVLSEATKPGKDKGVVAWLASQPLERHYVSAVTLGELHFGAERLPDGKRRQKLREWVKTVEEDYAGRIVPLDQAIAARWGALRAEYPNTPVVDGQIAATALTYGFALVTRNVKDFPVHEVHLINPWRERY